MSKTETSSRPPRRVRVKTGIYKQPSGTYEIGFRDATGTLRWRGPFTTIAKAETARAEEIVRRDGGGEVSSDPKMTFDRAADLWWETRAVRLRPATQSAYGASLTHVRKAFGRRKLTSIKARDIASFITEQSKTQKGWTVKGQLTVISAVFRFAAQHHGYAGSNPVAMLDKSDRPSSDDVSGKRILDPAELRRLLDSIEEHHRLIFEVGAETGARLSEALGLTWDKIDLDTGSIYFAEQLDRSGKLSPLKTKKSRRWVEITPALVAKLRVHKLAVSKSAGTDLVFRTKLGTPHDHRNIGGRVLARAVKKAKLEAVERDGVVVTPAPTFHDLRHSHASALIAQGWDIQEVSSRLGHADTAITLRTYTHEFDKANRSTDRRRRLADLYAIPVETSVETTDRDSEQRSAPEAMPETPELRVLSA